MYRIPQHKAISLNSPLLSAPLVKEREKIHESHYDRKPQSKTRKNMQLGKEKVKKLAERVIRGVCG